MLRAVAPLVLASFLCSACFSYAPAPMGPTLEQGAAVRLHLTRPVDVRLTDITANNVAQLQGEVATSTADEIVLSAWWLQSGSGYEFRGQGETVRIERANVQQVEQRKLSVWRTGALVALAALAGATFTVAEIGGGGRPPTAPPSGQ